MILAKEIDGELWVKVSDHHRLIKDAQRTWVGLVWGELPEDGQNHDFLRGAVWAETKLKEKNA
jgi:hypothetical protein